MEKKNIDYSKWPYPPSDEQYEPALPDANAPQTDYLSKILEFQ